MQIKDDDNIKKIFDAWEAQLLFMLEEAELRQMMIKPNEWFEINFRDISDNDWITN